MPRPCGKGRCRHGQGHWKQALQEKGYKYTPGRKSILDVLMKEEKPLSAEEIYFQVHAMCPSVGLTTIYRTMDLLCEMGIVAKIILDDNRARYELCHQCSQVKSQMRMICQNCQSIFYPGELEPDMQKLMDEYGKKMAGAQEFAVNHYVLHLFGICKDCQTKKIEL